LSPIWHSNCYCLVIVVCFVIENTVKQPFSCLKETELCIFCMETKKILLHLFWNCNLVNTFCFLLKTCYSIFNNKTNNNNKTITVWVSYWIQLNGCFTVFSIPKQNNNKTRTVWVSYWRQLNGCFTVFSIPKQNNNKTRTVWVSYWRQLNGCFTVFSIPKQNNNKTRTDWVSYWRQLNGCFTVFSIPKLECSSISGKLHDSSETYQWQKSTMFLW
jgi:predicted RecA/RadA family phage recombinase